MTVKKWYLILVLTAFAGFILLINTNSALADKHKINWLFIVAGVGFALIAIYAFYNANKLGNKKK
jgi:hypothetical protein